MKYNSRRKKKWQNQCDNYETVRFARDKILYGFKYIRTNRQSHQHNANVMDYFGNPNFCEPTAWVELYFRNKSLNFIE